MLRLALQSRGSATALSSHPTARFNGAALRRARKVAGRRRGRAAWRSCFNGAALRRARKGTSPSGPHWRAGSFNGPRSEEREKGLLPDPPHQSVFSLQWGRAQKSAEGVQHPQTTPSRRLQWAASEERGRTNASLRQAAAAGFNGPRQKSAEGGGGAGFTKGEHLQWAGLRRARKDSGVCCTGEASRASWAASEERRKALLHLASRRPPCSMGRAQKSAEDGFAVHDRPRMGFNGAALRRARKLL